MKGGEPPLGPYPEQDGWSWLYRSYAGAARALPLSRTLARAYFLPKPVEELRRGILYRLLGVHLFGRVIPTGGVAVRRLTGARMAPYTLSGHSLRAAGGFFYRACVFEALHLPFMLALLALSAHRLAIGRADLALEDLAVNLALNIYPIMHHRHTRVRIARLLRRAATKHA